MESIFGVVQSDGSYGGTIQDFLVGGNQLVSASGEINAYDKADAFKVQRELMQAHASGAIGTVKRRFNLNTEAAGMQLLAGLTDPAMMRAIASTASATVHEVNRRDGFLRNILMPMDLGQGERSEIEMPVHESYAVVAQGIGSVGLQPVNNRYFRPIEFTLQHAAVADDLEIKRSPSDMVQRMFDDGQEAMMVKEDRLLVEVLRRTQELGSNETLLPSGPFTPKLAAQFLNSIQGHGLPASVLLIANNVWQDIMGEPDFHAMFDPVTKHELVLTGRLSTLFGYTFVTDGYRKENQRVLRDGEMFALSTPEHVGVYTDRGGVEATPYDGTVTTSNSRGWYLREHVSITAPNGRAVQHLQRLL